MPVAPRYSSRPLPARRSRHSRPSGAARPAAPPAEPFDPARWAASESYRHAVDLHNFGFFFECHELLEGLWRGLPRTAPERAVLKGLVQVAAAQLKRAEGRSAAAGRLAARGVANLRRVRGRSLGITLAALAAQVEAYFAGRRRAPPRIRLLEDGPGPASGPGSGS